MYLSKVEIVGFKSFSQKTLLNFTDGLTAIVGPNGCGKTNIVDAQLLFETIPPPARNQSVFFTDFWKSYNFLEENRRVAASKNKGYTNHLKRFNNTLPQRCSRFVRLSLSFSKKMDNHTGAIKYFIAHYNKSLALLI